jgi:outer membrane protein assembly factor BamB
MCARSVFLMTLMAVQLVSTAEPVVEWTLEMEALPKGVTLFPNAEAPTGFAASGGQEVVRVQGDGTEVWRVKLDREVAITPTVADLNVDGAPEVIVSDSMGDVICWNAEGGELWRRSFDTFSDQFALITAADVHMSPGLELLFGFQDGWLYCLSAQGKTLWRFYGDAYRLGPPAAADVDGDGITEIVYGTDNGNIYCLDGTGRIEWRYSEFAPYGRSGVNLADLDGDGSVEVLLTRSNNGVERCLMALDGKTGAFKWRTQDVQQSYCSNTVADLDGDGSLEVLHSDKGNWFYCTNADGTERWRTELWGRGIFWASAVADINGDGAMEILVSVRDMDQAVGACAYVLSSQGEVLEKLKLGSSGNASPAVGDIDGDGELEVMFCTAGANGVQVLSWGAGGAVAAASCRSNSAMNAVQRVAAGRPEPGSLIASVGQALTGYWGDNQAQVSWHEPTPKDAFIYSEIRILDGSDEIRVTPVKQGATEARISWYYEGPQGGEASVAQFGGGIVFMSASQADEPVKALAVLRMEQEPAECDFEAVVQACLAVEKAGDAAGANTSSLQRALALLEIDKNNVLDDDPKQQAENATKLRRDAAELKTLAQSLGAYWGAGGAAPFVAWEDANPWDRFDPAAMPEALDPALKLRVRACGKEREDVVLNLLNITNEPLDVRCVFAKPELVKNRYAPEPELASHVTLRRGVRVPRHNQGMVLDCLPELDRSRTLNLTPGRVSQLWLTIDTYGLDAGEHELTLYIGSLERPANIQAIPLTIEVVSIELPEGVYAQMNWVGIDTEQTSDQKLKDMLDHGITVGYGPVLPSVPVNEQGELAGNVDWSRVDAGLARVPDYFQCLFHAPPAPQWPKGMKVGKKHPLYEKGFATCVREMAKHFKEVGWDYDRWALYPYDEPWLTGFTIVEPLREFCEMVKRADPKVRNYTDPAGRVKAEYLEEFKDLIDIFQLEGNLMRRDPELLQWCQDNARVFWRYEATDPGKDLLPLGYYRGYAWQAWHFGTQGAGFWCYQYYDIYWPLEQTHWSVVYQTNDEVVPSRRWEAVRDGQEDYRLFHALRTEIQSARAAGKAQAADEAQALLDQAVADVVGWQVYTIDEITRQTRDYELDYEMLLDYRGRIMEKILTLRK